jgi:transglutaminase-like putative cysteine protease
MTGADRLSLASVVAALCAGVTLFPLTDDRTYLLLALVLLASSALIGALLRRARVGEALVRVLQLAPVLLMPWLVPATRDPWQLYDETYAYVQAAFAPMPYQAGFAVLTAVLIWIVYLLTETLAIGLASPAWTFPVLVLPYLIPSLAIYTETSPFLFAFVAVGYALVLAAATSSSLPTPRGTDDTTAQSWQRAVAVTAAVATTVALVATILFSLPIPERSGSGPDTGGSGSVQLGDPSLDLIRNVNSNSNQVLITYRSSDGGGEYLRLIALPVFDEKGFHLTGTDLVPLQFDADPPDVAGPETVRTTVEVGNFGAEYLPMPWFPVTAEVSGDNWRYDPKTLAVVAVGTGRATATRGLTYETTSVRMPTVETLLPELATAGDPRDNGLTLQLPDDLSPEVRALAEQVTRNGTTAGAKALALTEFLRSDAFTYSTVATAGTTLGTLDDFLLGSRTGYCEQFAGSLAVMARAVGIPARVVVGFLPGRKLGEEWEVTARNMHAWTELYFGDGVGWVPVDATPSGAAGGPRPTATPTPSSSATSREPTIQPSASTATVAPSPAAGQNGGPLGSVPWVAAGAGLFVLALVGPRLTRAALRWFRLAGSADGRRATERAWAEVRAVTRDHGRDWPAGTSRQVAAELGPQLPREASAALRSLAVTVERTRYDREPVAPSDLAGEVRTITGAMDERWSRSGARNWWPRSLWPDRSS